jgi:uncharacterized protein YgiB involved in biofilm formation
MKTKIPLILLVTCFFCLTGCQQKNEQAIKSEVDKCVDAQVKADGATNDPLGIRPESKDTKVQARVEADARLECLKAQSGK